MFRFQHDGAQARFNDNRYGSEVPAIGDAWMYIQWAAIMVMVVAFYFHDLIHFAAVHDRMVNPIISAPVRA